MDGITDSDDSVEINWDGDGNGEEAASFSAAGAGPSRNTDAPGPSTWVANGNGKDGPSTSSVQVYVAMGFDENIVLKAMKDDGDIGTDALIDLLLTYRELGNDLSVDNDFVSGSAPITADDSDDNILENWDDEGAGGRSNRVDNVRWVERDALSGSQLRVK